MNKVASKFSCQVGKILDNSFKLTKTEVQKEETFNRNSFFVLTFVVVTFLTGCNAPARFEEQPWNFVFILIDDLGWTDLASYGSSFYETPNLDALAASGIRFTNAYATGPICSPTRASLMTGKYPATLKITDWIPGRRQWQWAKLLVPEFNQQLPLEEVTLAEALKPAGYVSASIGKWHIGGEGYYPTEQGFDLNIAGTHRGYPPNYFSPYQIPTLEGGEEGEFLTERLTEEAERFMEDNRDRPFFLYLTHFTVHTPLQAKQDVIDKYETKADPEAAQRHPVYAAMVESMDESVGQILEQIEKLGIAEKTIVLFASDNGGLIYEGSRKESVTSNVPLRAGKGHLYEGGIRVPMIVRWPGVTEPGTVVDVPVTSADFFPTILEMADLPESAGVDGESLVPLLRQSGTLGRESIFWHYPHYSNQGGEPSGAIRRGDYKLIELYRDGKLELYNLRNDIGEENDLAEQLPNRAGQLHRSLKKWRVGVGAAMPKENPDYDPAQSDQGLTGAQR